MEIPRPKSYLIDLVDTLGLSDDVERKYTKKGKECTRKIDYVEALQRYHLRQRYGSLDKVPQCMRLALKYFPQLATPKNQLKPASKQDEIWAAVWEDPDYIFEEKLDGMRFRWIYVRGEGLKCYSRHIDAIEFLPLEYSSNLCMEFDESKLQGIDSFFLDSELVCLNPNFCQLLSSEGLVAETQLAAVTSVMHMNSEDAIRLQKSGLKLKGYVFDCLMLNGEMLIEKPLVERKKSLLGIVGKLTEAGLPLVMHKSYRISLASKHKFFDTLVAQGREGLIAKRIDSPYSPDERINDWVKIKRSVGILGDTLSGFITGFKPGRKGSEFENLVGSLQISSNVIGDDGESEVRSIAWVKDMPLELRQKLTYYDTEGFPVLNPKFLNLVVNVDGQHFSSRTQHLVHAKIIEWRSDLTPFDCTVEAEWIESLIL